MLKVKKRENVEQSYNTVAEMLREVRNDIANISIHETSQLRHSVVNQVP